MSTDKIRQILVLFFAIGQWVTAGLLNSAFNEISNSAPEANINYFLPADYTFVVWGLITILSVVYALYQIQRRQKTRPTHRKVGGPIMLNTLCFSIWLVLSIQSGNYGSADFQPLWILGTVLVIIAMLMCNIIVFLELRNSASQLTTSDKWFIVIPTSVYFGWLTVATIANTTSFLYGLELSFGLFDPLISSILLFVAACIAGFVTLLQPTTQGAVAYSAVVMWAAIGIAAANIEQSALVTTAAFAVSTILFVLILIRANWKPLLA